MAAREENLLRKVNLKVKRYDPATRESKFQDYQVEVDDSAAVLDAIIEVR